MLHEDYVIKQMLTMHAFGKSNGIFCVLSFKTQAGYCQFCPIASPINAQLVLLRCVDGKSGRVECSLNSPMEYGIVGVLVEIVRAIPILIPCASGAYCASSHCRD